MKQVVYTLLICAFFLFLGFAWGRSGRKAIILPPVEVSAVPAPAKAKKVKPKALINEENTAPQKEGESEESNSAQTEKPKKPKETEAASYLEGELLLRLREGQSMAALLAFLKDNGINVAGELPELGLIRVILPEGLKVPEAEKLLGEGGLAETIRNAPVTIEPSPTSLAAAAPVRDNALALMSGTEINLGRGGENILVAVLDTGVDEEHPFLAGKTLGGYNFVDDMAFQKDNNGHGTACASLVLQTAPRAKILPVKVMSEKGISDGFSIAKGLVYAVKQGAKIINLSLGTTDETTLLDEAVNYAQENGVLIVASSGNEGKESENYPSSLNGVLCVGAIDGEKWKAPFSNSGPNVDLVAPGVLVAAAAPGGGYVLMSGTSASSPLVAGGAAALWSEHPNWTPAQISEKLLENADDLGAAGADDWYGAGLINLHRLLRQKDEYDLALTSLFFDPPKLIQGQTTEAVVVLQNQGTSTITDGSVVITVDGKEEESPLPKLAPNESCEFRKIIRLPEVRVQREMIVEIKAKTKKNDERYENNARRILISHSEEK